MAIFNKTPVVSITYKLSNQEVTSPVAGVRMNYVYYCKRTCIFSSAMRHYFSFTQEKTERK